MLKKWLKKYGKKKKGEPMTYSISRKYTMPKRFEMLDIGVEGLEYKDDIEKELKFFDVLAKEYYKKHEEIPYAAPPIPIKQVTPLIPKKDGEAPF